MMLVKYPAIIIGVARGVLRPRFPMGVEKIHNCFSCVTRTRNLMLSNCECDYVTKWAMCSKKVSNSSPLETTHACSF